MCLSFHLSIQLSIVQMHLYFILGDVLYRVTPKKIDKKNPAKLLMTNFLLEGSYYIMCVYDYIYLSLSLFLNTWVLWHPLFRQLQSVERHSLVKPRCTRIYHRNFPQKWPLQLPLALVLRWRMTWSTWGCSWGHLYRYSLAMVTIWLFNIAMENQHFQYVNHL